MAEASVPWDGQAARAVACRSVLPSDGIAVAAQHDTGGQYFSSFLG